MKCEAELGGPARLPTAWGYARGLHPFRKAFSPWSDIHWYVCLPSRMSYESFVRPGEGSFLLVGTYSPFKSI